MKLFVWVNPYPVPYGSSLAFAIGKDEMDAKRKLVAAKGYRFGEFERDDVGHVALKTPARVVELKDAAEWHEWYE